MYSLSFRRMGDKYSYVLFLHIFSRDFLSLRTTIFSDIENSPSASMSFCSDDLAQLLENQERMMTSFVLQRE